MRVISLQSGSNGNCTVVEGGGVRLIVDAGISGKRARQRLAAAGLDPADAEAVLISHDHRDHCQCAGIYHRVFGVDVYMTRRTLAAASRRVNLGRMAPVKHFHAGATIAFGDLRVETIPTPHDGADPVGFVIDDGHTRVGVLTDLGYVFDSLPDVIATLDAVVLESNHDEHMLATGPYPAFLKRRIRGDGGHISNDESARLVRDAANGLKWVCLAHLSEENNTPDRAIETYRTIVGAKLPCHVAGRYQATEPLAV